MGEYTLVWRKSTEGDYSKMSIKNIYQKTETEVLEPDAGVSQVSKRMLPQRVGIFPWVFLLGIAAAELLIGYSSVQAGMILQILILAAILWQVAASEHRLKLDDAVVDVANRKNMSEVSKRFYLSLTLVPLIRIVSLSIPLKAIPLPYWYLLVGIPIFVAVLLVNKQAGFQWKDFNLCIGKCQSLWRNIFLQLSIALSGILLGLIGINILKMPLLPRLTWGEVVLLALILLVFTGFTEELIFRGILRRAADDYLGRELAVVYVSFLFASLYITHMSVTCVFFVFGASVLFTLFVYRTESLLGVALAHGLANITLLLIAPQLLL